MSEEWDLIINKESKGSSVFRTIFRYKYLIKMLVLRDLVVVYKQTVLGPLWFFIQPILTAFIYYVVFGKIAGIDTLGVPKMLFYMCGIVIWNYFSECFVQISDTFIQNQEIFGKVYFPRLAVPISKICSALIKLLIQTVLFLVFILIFYFKGYTPEVSIYLLFFPVVVALVGFYGLGFGLIFSSLTSKYRDVRFLLQFGIQLVMYSTPIFYPLSGVGEEIKAVLFFNPFVHIMEFTRFMFFGYGEISLLGIVYTVILCFVLLFLGVRVFTQTEKNFIDTV